ncbi:STAS domain-containing protein [Methylomonas albis]|jgi:HptB-dependent secretion and biofilm anti anti-sigma factor|uniref:STAS domain-containing protein n=1 Tax=Methylomonas albis TaxID=1854563 RepID=A0ABR9CYU6_9GAMM|nr:STAS domain-containing protein [Methylomonas albis]MBD9355686.1 STAS domain-containing protein [Methylomonas albis]
MGIEAKVDAGVLSIRINGRFDFGVHNEFREATKFVDSGIKLVEVDLNGTDYLDSSALGMLLVLRDKVAGDKSAIRIKNSRTEVKKILEIANFDKLFTLS